MRDYIKKSVTARDYAGNSYNKLDYSEEQILTCFPSYKRHKNSLGRRPSEDNKMLAKQKDKIKSLLESGYTKKAIAKELGLSQSMLLRFTAKQGWRGTYKRVGRK